MHREQRNAIIFILSSVNIWLRSLHVSAVQLENTDSALPTTTPKVVCSKAGPGYFKVNEADIERHKRFIPPGCNLVSGRGNLVSCVKLVCPCKDKGCGDTCVPAKPGRGPFKCQTSTSGARYSICVTAASVKCPDTATTGQATRTPFVLTKTTPEKDLTATKVDCSKAGPQYSYLDYIYVKGAANSSTARARVGRFLSPGCSMISGRGIFVNCVKIVCPCKDKACGDTCVPTTESIGQFKCQARAKGSGCVPADSVECPAPKVVVTSKSNMRADKKTTPGIAIAKPAGGSNTGTDVTTKTKKVTGTAITKKSVISLRTRGTKAAIEATVGDARTAFQATAVVTADPACANDVGLVVVLLLALLLLSQ